MPVITLASASGSPGVTTAALGLAESWPRPVVLVEADPTGGSGILAGFLRGEVEPAGGLLELVMAQRNGAIEVSPEVLMPLMDGRVRLLPGIRAHSQARSLASVWEPLLTALRNATGGTGQDVIVDAGRLGLNGWPEPLVRGSDITVLVTRSSLPALAAARSWLDELRHDNPLLGVVVVGAGRPYSAREVARWLRVPVFGEVAWDPGSAAVFSDGAQRPRRFDHSGFARSLRTVGEGIRVRCVAVDLDEEQKVRGVR